MPQKPLRRKYNETKGSQTPPTARETQSQTKMAIPVCGEVQEERFYTQPEGSLEYGFQVNGGVSKTSQNFHPQKL